MSEEIESVECRCACDAVRLFIDPYIMTLLSLGRFDPKSNALVISEGLAIASDAEGDLDTALAMIMIGALTHWEGSDDGGAHVCSRLGLAADKVRSMFPVTADDVAASAQNPSES